MLQLNKTLAIVLAFKEGQSSESYELNVFYVIYVSCYLFMGERPVQNIMTEKT